MANTMKFGNGQWATKKDSILAYNDENANFKPLPFVTSRASTATRVNKAGLLETVASGIPRVDYLGNTKGAYLLEQSSTNLITQSEAFGNSYWTKSGASVEGDASTAGSEQVVNGDFATTSNWVLAGESIISGGRGIVYSSAGAFSNIKQLGILTVGKNYILKFDILTETSGYIKIGSSNGGSDITGNVSSVGSYTYHFNAVDTLISFARGGSITHIYIDNVSIKEVQGFSAPSADTPLGAFKLVGDANNSQHSCKGVNIVASGTYVYSFYAKKNESDFIQVANQSTTDVVNFDLNNGTYNSIGSVSSASMDLLSNGFYRCVVYFGSTFSGIYNSLVTSLTSARLESFVATGYSTYIFGAQLEAQSYPTSYIPTAGSAITRLSDTASQTVPDGIIGQTEGVLFIEASSLVNGADNRITLSGGSSSNRVSIEFDANANTIKGFMGSNGFLQTTSYNQTNNLKIALNYKANDFKMFINGVKIGTDTTATISTGINRLDFSNYNGDVPFYGNTKDIRVYNTVLTDAELAKLTKI